MPWKGLDNPLDRRGIDRMAGKTAVQIDNMQMLRPRLREQGRLRRRIVAIDGRAVHIPLGQAHDLPVFQIDGGKNDKAQGRHSRKRDRKERP